MKKDITQETKESAAEWVDRSVLKPWDKNPRNNADNVKRVMASIQRFGFAAPILARRADGEVIAGHTRLLAAEALGMERVPVRYLDLDPGEAHMLAIADNRLTEKSEWNNDLLMAQLDSMGLDNAELVGFDSADLEEIAKDLDSGHLEADYEEPVEKQNELMTFVVSMDERVAIETALSLVDAPPTEGRARDTNALMYLLGIA